MNYDKYAWHIAYVEPNSEEDAAYINALIQLARTYTGKEYKKILDVACGNGRLHPFLKRHGYDIEGFDISETLVEEARGKGLNVWQGDMRDEKNYRERYYDVVLSWYTSFPYFDDETHEKVLRLWNRALKKGGILILDTAVKREENNAFNAVTEEKGLVEILEEKPLDEKHRLLKIRIFRDRGTKMELKKEILVKVTLYSIEELSKMLEKAGFRIIKAYRSRCFRSAKRQVTFLAVKERDL